MTTQTKKINITPDKSLFPKMGQVGYTTAEALAELIDNSIDARGKLVDIKIRIDKNAGKIVVEDNGRGMTEEAAGSSIRLGASQKTEGQLGQFGIGLKSACMSLGRKFTIETSPANKDEEYVIVFDEEEFMSSRGKWEEHELRVNKGGDRSRSYTRITIEKLRIKFYGTLQDVLKRHLSERFTPFIANREASISLNGEKITAMPFEIFPDSKKKFTIMLSNGAEVHGWTGILKVGSVERSGFNLYRYNRLIRAHEKLGYIYHPSKMAVTGEIHMDSLPVTTNKREFETENDLYIEFYRKFSEHLKPILAEIQNRHQEERIKELPRELRETLKDNLLKALNETDDFKELAFPNSKPLKRSKDETGELLNKEIRESQEVAGVEREEPQSTKNRTPRKTTADRVRFIMIAGERYKFDYSWEPLEESVAKQAYLDKDKNTIMVLLNSRYHILKVMPKPDLFYHVIYLTEGIVEVFLRENKASIDRLVVLRDKLTQQLADILAEDVATEDTIKDAQLIEAKTYLLKPEKSEITLNQREQLVLKRRLAEDKTLQEIAAELGVSRARADQIYSGAVRKINGIHVSQTKSRAGVGIPDVTGEEVATILEKVAGAYGITVEQMLSKSRKAELVVPRQTAMYLLRKELRLPFPKIGQALQRDHSTVIHAYKKMAEAAKTST